MPTDSCTRTPPPATAGAARDNAPDKVQDQAQDPMQDKAEEYRGRLYDGGLQMLYQPIVDLRCAATVKVEALARLRMRDGCVVCPSDFLPAFGVEELAELFREGLEQSLRSLRNWDALGLRLGIGVNLPPAILGDPACVDWVAQALHTHQVEPGRLSLELLEQPFDDITAQQRVLERLRELGVRLAMDDFGSGHSDMQRFRSIRFDVLKIDHMLTRRLASRPRQDARGGSALLGFASRLGCEVVVEGVDGPASLRAANDLGAQYAQGNGIALPMPGDAVKPWVDAFGAAQLRGSSRRATWFAQAARA